MSKDFKPLDLDLYLHLRTAFAACDQAGEILGNHFGNLRNLEEKFQAGLVSDADRESERVITSLIRGNFPNDGVLGEEFGLSEGVIGSGSSAPEALWMIDPLDGTTNFVHQFPVFCISIGLEVKGELVLGVVDAPKLGMRFHAVKGQGAFLNGQPIRVSNRTRFQDGLFATGFFGHDNTLDEQLAMVARTIRDARGIRRAGAAALDLCFVAQGVFDVFWEKNLAAWDTAAGVVIAREAGAIATDMEGNEFNPRLKSVLCGSPFMHGEALKMIRDVRAERVVAKTSAPASGPV